MKGVMETTQALAGCAVLVLCASLTGPIPALNVRELVDKADMIAVGTVTSVSERGRVSVALTSWAATGTAMSATLQLGHIIKGEYVGSAVEFRFIRTDLPIGYGTVEDGAYRILFLRASRDGYVVEEPYYPSLPASPGPAPEGTTALERVVASLATVLGSRSVGSEAKREAIHSLWGIRDESAISALRMTLTEREQDLQLSAAAALLAVNDATPIDAATSALLNPGLESESGLLHNLRVAIAQGVANEAALPNLVRLLAAGDTETRRAASSALRHMHSRSAIPEVLKALDDSDTQVRHNAVMALAEATEQVAWGPSLSAFKADEERYVRHWKEWSKSVERRQERE